MNEEYIQIVRVSFTDEEIYDLIDLTATASALAERVNAYTLKEG
jgi:hypothetical protein